MKNLQSPTVLLSYDACPMTPALGPQQVHLYYARPDCLGDKALESQCRAALSHDERLKAGRFHSKDDKRLSITARAMIRYVISVYTGRNPADLSFCANDFGKPELVQDTAEKAGRVLRFNVSHCRGGVLMGLCLGHDIGVDIETLDRRVNPGVAERFFCPREASRVRAARDKTKQKAVFLDIWTLKEAYIKAVGRGLAIPLNSFCVDEGRTDGHGSCLDAEWQFFRWSPERATIGAAAVRSSEALSVQTFHCIPFRTITAKGGCQRL